VAKPLVGSRALNLEVDKMQMLAEEILSPLSVKQEAATDGVRPWIL
jgi:hypothetical protein